jgi:large subunit ribosomal protein L17
VSEHRTALLRNQAEALLAHEKIETTVPKAKELRPFVERLITIAKRGVRANDPKGVSLSARRLVMRDVLNETVVTKLFDELAPRFMERPGGYTRILKLGHRRGDAAEVAQIELIGSEFDPKKAEEEKKAREAAAEAGEAPKQTKSVGERLRAAAKNIGGGKKQDGGAKNKASKPARGGAKKTTTPRKAGGS